MQNIYMAQLFHKHLDELIQLLIIHAGFLFTALFFVIR